MAIHDMTYTAQSMSYTCTYHLPASENLTQFLQAPLATPGFPEPPFWPPFWRGLGGRGGPGGPGLAAPVLSAPIWLDVLPGLAGVARDGC